MPWAVRSPVAPGGRGVPRRFALRCGPALACAVEEESVSYPGREDWPNERPVGDACRYAESDAPDSRRPDDGGWPPRSDGRGSRPDDRDGDPYSRRRADGDSYPRARGEGGFGPDDRWPGGGDERGYRV